VSVDDDGSTPTSRGDPGLFGWSSCPGVSQGTSGVVRGRRVAVSEVVPRTLLVRGDLGQLRGVARDGSGFIAIGAR